MRLALCVLGLFSAETDGQWGERRMPHMVTSPVLEMMGFSSKEI